MDSVSDFVTIYRDGLIVAGLLFLTVLLASIFWENIRFFLMDLSYRMPLFGKLKRYSKDLTIDQSGWFKSETALANDYEAFYREVYASPERFDKCRAYIAAAGETGRSPFRWYMWVLVSVMVIIESLGFAYVLAGFTIPGASENVLKMGSIGISILISILLVGFTHWAGKELYTNSLMERARNLWQPEANGGERLRQSRGDVTIEHNDVDIDSQDAIRILNRVSSDGRDTKRYVVTMFTAALVVIIAVGATYVRGVVLERELQYETSNSMSQIGTGAGGSFFPNAMTEPQNQADKQAIQDGVDLDRQGGWGTFIVLAVIFVFMQIFGVIAGYKFGFAGKESAKASAETRKFRDRDHYIQWHDNKAEAIMQIAQSRLAVLQRLIAIKVDKRGNLPEQTRAVDNAKMRTARDHFMKVMRDRVATHHDRAEAATKKATPMAPVQATVVAHAPVQAPAPALEAAPVIDSAATVVSVSEPPASPSVAPAAGAETEEEMRARIKAELIAKRKAEREEEIRREIEAELEGEAAGGRT